ncbi:hypothetical protein ACFQ88_07455 [Paenibacillus sp. NPDC056579]|uniref:hypothetical protein n=1 Tax=unclassified Paenibacillus TaxID=185978 RepID=UPI001EF7869C|nr:hypothetical protein [Paenibacillus sp. H1-7]ULL16776.1 hypothetical protein DVH26_21415 [Paenibacillus sp. H1-7]
MVANKTIIWGAAVLAIGAAVLTEAITTNVQVGTTTTKSQTLGDSSERLPDVLLEDSKHPDKIITKDGSYALKKELPDYNFSSDEIAYDIYKTNAKTKMLLKDGDIYIKDENR